MPSAGHTVIYPEFLNFLGDIVGTVRNLTNLEMNEELVRFKRGDRSELVNCLGARGELIARFVCFQKEVKYTATNLIAPAPLGEPDIIYNGHRFDVKTIRSDAPDLLVNEEAHKKVSKDITHYWFIQQKKKKKNEARYWVYSYEDVSGWAVKTPGHSPAYYLKI